MYTLTSEILPHHEPLFDLIQTRLALTLDDQRRADIAHIVEGLIESHDINNVESLVLTLSEQPFTFELWQRLIQAATIGETYFFRDKNQMNALRLSVLPGLIKERRAEGKLRLRLWSAACSTGEEPYTLAMMLCELIPDIRSWDISILATDLNNNNIARARLGIFRPWSFRAETPDEIRQRWFVEELGSYRLDPFIRDMVTFASLNLASDAYPSFLNNTMEMDVILCRNVLIYFDIPSASAVATRLGNALNNHGWLVLGHAEAAYLAPREDLKPCNFEYAVFYQKNAYSEQDRERTSRAVDKSPLQNHTLSTTRVSAPSSLTTNPTAIQVNAQACPPSQLDALDCAWAAANKEQWAEALYWLAEAAKQNKLRPEVHYLRGVVEMQQGEMDKALGSLRQALYCDSNFVMAHYTLGEVYERRGHYKKASSQWNQARNILASLAPEAQILFSNDLTAGMLSGLLQNCIVNLPLAD